MRRHKTVIFLTLGFLVGICILLYPAFSDYWNSKTQSRAITNYESVLEKLEVADYTAVFEQAYAYNKALFTCTPYGINTHRLLVRGVRIETVKEKPIIYVSNEAYRIEPLLVTPAVAAPMLLGLLIHLLVKYRQPPKDVQIKKKLKGEIGNGT